MGQELIDSDLKVVVDHLSKEYRESHPLGLPSEWDSGGVDLEALYSVLLSTVVQLARVLGKPCPVVTRQERRGLRVP